MEVIELRIGNYLTLSKYQRMELWRDQISAFEKDFFEVMTLYKCNEAALDLDDEIVDFDLSVCEPVLLTEEWLEKLGFKKTIDNKDSGYKQYGLQRMGLDFMVCIEVDTEPDVYIQNKIVVSTRYVHQLQNIYHALTGEELKL